VHERVPDWPAEHISVVKNGVDLSRFDPDEDGRTLRAELGIDPDAFVALYAGTHGQSQQLEQVVDAAVLAPEVQWVLVGQGQRKAELIKRGQGIENLTFLPAVSPDRMPELYALADVCLVVLKDLAIFERTIPSKMFEIWAAGRPQVLGVRGEAARMLEASGAGLAVAPEDPRAMAEAVSLLAADPGLCAQMGASGRAYVAEHFERKVLARKYLAVLKQAAFG
ncbi:MAG: glycosyltransferase involved in cell wall biosynthesis, partial [Kiritimatiellia bacterium]